jgi:signal transduction histidine kinase
MKRLTLLLLCLCCGFLSCNDFKLRRHFEPEVWEQIEEKFLTDQVPTRFYGNILVHITGNPAPEDSAVMARLINEVNGLIEVWNVSLTPTAKTASIIFDINNPEEFGSYNRPRYKDNIIVQTRIVLYLYQPPGSPERAKAIYYYFLRSLAKFRNGYTVSDHPIPGFVFDETNPKNITFHPLDQKVVKALYSKVFEDHQPKFPDPNRYFILVFYFLAFFLFILFLLSMDRLGFFQSHHYRFRPFFLQGLIVIVAVIIYQFTVLAGYHLFGKTQIRNIQEITKTIPLGVIGAFAIVLIVYAIERPLLKGKNNMMLRTVIPFMSMTLAFLLITALTWALSGQKNMQSLSAFIVSQSILTAYYTCIRTFYIYLCIQSQNAVREKDVELARLSELHKQAELRSLQSKINPHFLYNALNSIAGLAATDPGKTEKMALALADFFKYSLNKGQKTMVTLKEEIESVGTYLCIEKVRFGERLDYSVDLPKELENIRIPQFIIQPVVENAMKHGISKLPGGGRLKVEIKQRNNQLEIRIFDNGPDFPDELVSGYGIQSIQDKLQLLYQGKAFLKWENGAGKHFQIVLPLETKN